MKFLLFIIIFAFIFYNLSNKILSFFIHFISFWISWFYIFYIICLVCLLIIFLHYVFSIYICLLWVCFFELALQRAIQLALSITFNIFNISFRFLFFVASWLLESSFRYWCINLLVFTQIAYLFYRSNKTRRWFRSARVCGNESETEQRAKERTKGKQGK